MSNGWMTPNQIRVIEGLPAIKSGSMKTKFGAPVLQVKDFGEDGFFSGYGAVFGNKDSHGDIIQRGAFAKSVQQHKARGTRPKMFWQHDMSKPIGRWTDFEEDDTGLRMEGKLNMNVQQGREAYHLLKDEDIDGLSIGYRTIREEQKDGANLLHELGLVETSVVSLGSNDQALVSAIKQIRGDELPSLSQFEDFLREAGFSKTEATAIAGNGLSHLLRGEPGSASDDEARAFLAALSGHQPA